MTSVPQSQTKEIEPGLVETLIRRWPLLAGGALLGALAAFLNLTLVPSKYESKARVLLVKMHPDMAPGFEANHRGPEDYVATQLGIMQSAVVAENAARAAGPTLQSIGKRNDTTEDILDGLSAKRDSKERNSNIVELSFNCPYRLRDVIYVIANGLERKTKTGINDNKKKFQTVPDNAFCWTFKAKCHLWTLKSSLENCNLKRD